MNWYYWRNWRWDYKILFWFFSVTLFSISFFLLYAWFAGYDLAIDWYKTSETTLVDVPVSDVNVGLFNLQVKGQVYLVSQYFDGGPIQIKPAFYILQLILLSFTLIVCLTSITYFKRFWYLIAMILFMLGINTMAWEQIMLFGWLDKKVLLPVFIAYVLPSYYFQAYGKYTGFWARVLTFTFSTLVIYLIVNFYSEVDQPFLYLATYGLSLSLILTILFILFISHEIIYFILSITHNAKTSLDSKSGTHFIILSVIYILNLLVTYTHIKGIFNWDIFYLPPYWLFVISTWIAFWTFRHKTPFFSITTPFKPFGGFFFLVLGILALGTLCIQYLLANDPVIEAFEEIIIFTHIGMSFLFFFYTLSNFIDPLMKNLLVQKIVYKEQHFPYVTAIIGGLAIAFGLFFYHHKITYELSKAGTLNAIADLYDILGEDFLAHQYYEEGSIYGYHNHRSCYKLAEIHAQKNEILEANYFYGLAADRNPSEYSFIRQAKTYEQENLFFKSLFALQAGLEVFPDSKPIKNNLGLLYAQTDLLDSAFTFFNHNNETSIINLYNLYTQAYLDLSKDTINQMLAYTDQFPAKANLMALAAVNRYHDLDVDLMKVDSTLNAHTLSYLNNIATTETDPEVLKVLRSCYQHPSNADYRPVIGFTLANLLYKSGDIAEAFFQLDLMAHDYSAKSGYFNHVLGIWALEQNAPKLAVDFFKEAYFKKYDDSNINLPIALGEAGEHMQATKAWKQAIVEDSSLQEMAGDMLGILLADLIDMENEEDRLKYQFVRFRKQDYLYNDLVRFIESIENKNYRALSYLTLIKHYLEYDKNFITSELWNKVNSMKALHPGLTEKIDREKNSLQVTLDYTTEKEKIGVFGYINPFDERQVIAWARYFREAQDNPLKAYDILLKAKDFNKYSPLLTKAYIFEALSNRLYDYAEDALDKSSTYLPKEEYEKIKSEYFTKKKYIEDEEAQWSF
ncbi:MAG TPA: hypothetical protein ACFCUD_14045 [Cyclobacteriaceae bacterium]